MSQKNLRRFTNNLSSNLYGSVWFLCRGGMLDGDGGQRGLWGPMGGMQDVWGGWGRAVVEALAAGLCGDAACRITALCPHLSPYVRPWCLELQVWGWRSPEWGWGAACGPALCSARGSLQWEPCSSSCALSPSAPAALEKPAGSVPFPSFNKRAASIWFFFFFCGGGGRNPLEPFPT